jgi:Na+-translocating ferredoxin:NAD+ oxidoreductase RNF subunit RnfB
MLNSSTIKKASFLAVALQVCWASAIYAGVGGGVEARESVDIAEILKFSAVFLLGISAVFGLGLAFAAKKFAVQEDPRVEQVSDFLAHAHCGACGYPGCRQYAEAVVLNPDVPANLCTPGGKHTAEAVAKITGKEMKVTEPRVARVFCQGGISKSRRRFKYEGVMDCRAAVVASGGDKACIYGCLGYGTCSRVCPFGAISMSEENLPLIDPVKCTSCGQCVQACPKNVIEIQPLIKEVLVRCHSKDKGAATRKGCQVGCIACGMCVKVCPYNAPALENNLSRINLDKCRVCSLCVRKCPTNAILDSLPQRPKAVITEKCIGCGSCMKICPVNAAYGEKKKLHAVNQEKCIGCGMCTAKCPVVAITGTINYPEVLQAYEEKKAARASAKAEAETEAKTKEPTASA